MRVALLVFGSLIALIGLPPLYYSAFPAEVPQLPPPGRRIDVGGGITVNAIVEGQGRPTHSSSPW